MTKKTKDKIIFTAESLLESNEYKDISIREVAFLSGISIGTFYRYMNSKEELLEQLKIKFDQKVYNTLLKQTKGKNPIEKILIFFDTYINYITKYNYKFFVFFIPTLLEKQDFISQSKNLCLLKQYIEEAYESDGFNDIYSQDYIFRTLSSFFIGTIFNWCFSMGKSDMKKDFFSNFDTLISKFKN
ncbi:Bacterial regulatory proteins, tetR family [Sebaldella termitidis]|uniref:Transcriptional regulator, TetR family n=1 Tax=Sebaldella termitidis (strain ATCC 33386 / NCTC 11300) TaxID=526218 RepID=D1AQU0_SEBTE|nr:TetR/AcrR family transcriptional regulator [Sebaldella termitidis]ACZ10350.1 transcriptional regulator, TetR family [Sebaldella termitidis ATCC 33386]SUI25691.1 Bacterial regulatory proteins, tetR family [Sebaldella termitidis]